MPFAQTLSIFNIQDKDKDKVACCHHCNVPLEPMTGKEKWEAETVTKSLPHWNELEKTVSCPEPCHKVWANGAIETHPHLTANEATDTNCALEFAENSIVLQLFCFDNPY